MTTSNNTFASTTTVAFHIGRGGHFNNSGHVSYLDCNVKIGDYTNDLSIIFENQLEIAASLEVNMPGKQRRRNIEKLFDTATDDIHTKEAEKARERCEFITGKSFGELCYGYDGTAIISVEDVEKGVGIVNIDHDYDTTYVKYLSECGEEELELIANSPINVPSEVKDYCKSILGESVDTEEVVSLLMPADWSYEFVGQSPDEEIMDWLTSEIIEGISEDLINDILEERKDDIEDSYDGGGDINRYAAHYIADMVARQLVECPYDGVTFKASL
jgi:hypothetical protein